jgi:drug/metabolite transporter (DMT)-like permease
MNREHQRAILFMTGTALLWSMGGFLIKGVNWNPVAIAGTRSAVAAVLMALYCRKPSFNWSFEQIGGAVFYAATVILFVTANKLTTAANAILLQYTAPVYVAIFSWWFLGERVNRADWVTIIVTLGGMVLFFRDNLSSGGFWGNIAAIASGAAFAALCLFARKQKNGSSLESLLLGNLLTALIGLPFMFRGPFPDAGGWLYIAVLGIFQLGLSYILYAKAMKRLSALEGILIPVIEPVLNPIWVFLLLHETPGTGAILGGILILTAVTVRCVLGAVRQNQESSTKNS